MNHLKHILFASALVASMSAAAQETYQDTKLAASQLTGTARYVGMGGAMEALGADISTISTNPAGVGLFRKNQISLSAGVIAQSGADNSVSFGEYAIDFDGKKSHPTFDQIGIVWSTKMRNSSALNLAFNYHKSTDFGQLLNAANSLTKASQNKLTAAKNAEGVDGWSAADANFGGYKDNSGKYQNGLLNLTSDGYLSYAEANSYLFGQYQHGYIGSYDFNISGSIGNRVWLGLTIGLHDVHYNSNSLYAENLVDGNFCDSYEQIKITGTGYDVKAGIIFRPVEESPFRIGAYVNSPVFYDLSLSAAHDLSMYGGEAPATFQDKNAAGNIVNVPCYTKGDKGQTVDYDFRLNTPWKVGVSMGHTVGNYLALGATYEYAWYDHMDNRVKDGGYYDYYWGDYYETSSSDEAMNDHTKHSLQGVSTLKLGLEYKPIPLMSIRLGYNYVSPMFKENADRDQTIASQGTIYSTSTDYTNWKATNRVTAGVGFNYQSLFFDVAYQYSCQKGDFYPFAAWENVGAKVAPATSVDNNRHQLLMTVGYKF